MLVSAPVQTALVVAWTVWWACYISERWGWAISWFFFIAGPRRLVGLGYPHWGAPGGLHLYASYPRLQIGPLSFLVALPLALLPGYASTAIGCALMVAAGPVVVGLLADAARRAHGWSRAETWRAAGRVWFLLAPMWWLLAAFWGHLDDVLALLFVAAAINLLGRGRAATAAVLIGASAASKPWALAFIPLVLVAVDGRRIRHLATATTIAFLPWLPFVIAVPETLRTGSFRIHVIAASVLSLFHVTGGTPLWVRPTQFLGGAALVALSVWSGRWAAGVALALALRMGIDPNVYSYYTTGLIVGTSIWDLLGSRIRIPVLSATTLVTLYGTTYLHLPEHDHAVLQLVTVLAVPGIVVLTSPRRRSDAADAIGSVPTKGVPDADVGPGDRRRRLDARERPPAAARLLRRPLSAHRARHDDGRAARSRAQVGPALLHDADRASGRR